MLKKLAHNSTIPIGGNSDLKALQDLITAEKTVLTSIQKLSVDFGKASEALRTWGLGEGDDLGDTLSASTAILMHFSSALSQYASHEHVIREHLKAVRTREEALDELKRRRKNVAGKADSAERKVNKMSPEHKNLPGQTEILNSLREEIRGMDSDIMTEEAQLGDFKRTSSRDWMTLKFGGLLECCEKGVIVGEVGRMVIAEIPDEVTQPGMPRNHYNGHAKVESLMSEAQRCVGEVVFPTGHTSRPKPRVQQMSSEQGDSSTNSQWPNNAAGPGPHYLSPPLGNTTSSFLPPLGGPQSQQGGGHFMDLSETSSFGGASGLAPSAYPQQAPYPTSQYPEPETYVPSPRAVDDFGVVQSHPSGPLDPPTGQGGSRFATFPVKTSTPSGFSLRDDPPSITPHDENGPSFASSIAEALGTPTAATASNNNQEPHSPTVPDKPSAYGGEPLQNHNTGSSFQPQHTNYAPPSGPPPGTNHDGSPYQVSHAHNYTPPPGPPRGASLGSVVNPWESSHGRSTSNVSADTGLAYDAFEPAHTPPTYSSHQQDHHEDNKHTRFGGVSDIDEELEHRAEVKRLSQQKEQEPHPAPVAAPAPSKPADGPAPSYHTRVLPPTFDPAEEERALNAAAAREVSLELSFSPHGGNNRSSFMASPPVPTDRGNSSLGYGQNASPPARDPSPLAPPAPPFGAKRAVSPMPSVNTNLPGSGTATPPYTPNRQSTYVDTPNPFPPGAVASPTTTPSIALPNVEDHPRSSSPLSTHSGNPPPADHPRGLGKGTAPYASSPMAKSNSSLSSPVLGARTISAAAFKRPMPRMSSDTGFGSAGSIADTSPLSFKKRLPASPYPTRDRSVSSSTGLGSPVAQQQPPQRRDSNGHGNPPPPPPPSHGYEHANDGEDDFDYISAYTRASSDGDRHQHAGGNAPASPGYAEGRFATDLEDRGNSGLR